MTAIHFTFAPGAQREADWKDWASANGFAESPGWGPWRKGPEIEADFTARGVTFSAPYLSDQTDGMILLALSFWQKFSGGQVDAPSEVIIRLLRALESSVLAKKVTDDLVARRRVTS